MPRHVAHGRRSYGLGACNSLVHPVLAIRGDLFSALRGEQRHYFCQR